MQPLAILFAGIAAGSALFGRPADAEDRPSTIRAGRLAPVRRRYRRWMNQRIRVTIKLTRMLVASGK